MTGSCGILLGFVHSPVFTCVARWWSLWILQFRGEALEFHGHTLSGAHWCYWQCSDHQCSKRLGSPSSLEFHKSRWMTLNLHLEFSVKIHENTTFIGNATTNVVMTDSNSATVPDPIIASGLPTETWDFDSQMQNTYDTVHPNWWTPSRLPPPRNERERETYTKYVSSPWQKSVHDSMKVYSLSYFIIFYNISIVSTLCYLFPFNSNIPMDASPSYFNDTLWLARWWIQSWHPLDDTVCLPGDRMYQDSRWMIRMEQDD